MPVKKAETIWMNGKLISWDDARIHILSHVVHYGSGWFEGIRCYNTKKGPAIFRLDAHLRRLYDSVKIYRTEIPYTKQQLSDAVRETIKANKLKACYIRPLVYRGYGEVGVNPLGCPVDVSIAVWEWGAYLGEDALELPVEEEARIRDFNRERGPCGMRISVVRACSRDYREVGLGL